MTFELPDAITLPAVVWFLIGFIVGAVPWLVSALWLEMVVKPRKRKDEQAARINEIEQRRNEVRQILRTDYLLNLQTNAVVGGSRTAPTD